MNDVRLPRLLQKKLAADNNTLVEVGRLHPAQLSVELNLYPLSRASMTLNEDDLPVQMHDFVELYGQNGSLGIFRVASISTTYRKQRQIQLNHALDVFTDAVLAGEMTITGTVREALSQIIAGQTANLNGTPYWRLGTCADENQYSTDVSYTNAMQMLTDIAKNEEDYYFTFDFSRFPWTINFIARNDTVLSEFRLSRNVENCQVTLNDSDLCTKLYLSIDTTTTTDDGSTTTTTHEIHEDKAAQAVWGIVAKTAGIKAEAVPDKAAWVQQYFKQHAQPSVQISISGLEVNRLTGESIDAMHLGRVCRVALPDYNTVFNERIVSFSYPDILHSPMKVQVSLANKKQDAGGSFASLNSQASATAEKASKTEKTVQNNQTQNNYRFVAQDKHITEHGTILHEAGLEIDPHGVWLFAKEEGALGTMQANLRVQSEAITAEVSRATQKEGELSSRLQVTADAVTAATGRIQRVEGDISTIQGSALWLRRDSITGVTGKMEVDADGNLIVKDGAGFRARYGNAEYGIFNENNLTAGVLVDKINGGTTKILGNRVNIEANESFTSVVGEVTRTGNWINEYQGTGIYQNRDNINAVAGKFRVDANGNVHVVNGSGLYLGEGSASLAVYKSGDITAGFIVDQINGGTATIQGNHINLNANESFRLKVGKGDVATQLAVECGNVTISNGNLVVDGYITAAGLNSIMGNFTGSISAGTITARNNFYIGNSLVSSHGAKFNGTMKFTYLTTATADAEITYADLPHYHDITIDVQDGKVTITQGAAQDTPGTGTFNIADTQYFKDAVASAKNDRSVKASNFTITNVTEYPSSNIIMFSVNATANDGTVYTSATQMVTYSGGGGGDTYTPVNYAKKGLTSVGYAKLYRYDDDRGAYVSVGTHNWYWAGSDGWDTLYEKN